MAKHPVQPIEMINGVARFKANGVVTFLLKEGQIDLNSIVGRSYDKASGITKDDLRQFWQLLGYSVSGYGDLSFADHKVVACADSAVKKMTKSKTKQGKSCL